MNKTASWYSIGLASLILAIAGLLFVFSTHIEQARAGNVDTSPAIRSATTTTAFSVTSSARIAATSSDPIANTGYLRVYASICNPNANPVYIRMDADKAASLSGYTAVIAAAAGYSVCYEVTDRNLYQGSITASSTNQTATSVMVADYVR